MQPKLEKLRGQMVDVTAKGIEYSGKLHGADEELIYLIGTTGYLTIPMIDVTSVRPQGETPELDDNTAGLTPEFFTPPDTGNEGGSSDPDR